MLSTKNKIRGDVTNGFARKEHRLEAVDTSTIRL